MIRHSKRSLEAPAHDPLGAYQSKRDFALTPEPATGGQSVVDQLRFVVQKHWASSLHYDFRLELDGTMKSWAVPKGPSLDPSVKRMAVQVEDHPLAYADFEGTIPAKQYGAGKVIVWDAGTWLPLQDPQQGVRDGNLKFELHGHKLHGRWVLVRMKGKGEKQPAWLLIKEKDSYARPSTEYSVVDELPASVKSLGPASRGAAAAADGHRSASNHDLPVEAVPSALPHSLAPQLATLVAGPPPDAAEWLYEIKFDGYRMLVRNDASGARLLTRNGHDWTSKLRPLQSAFERLRLPPGWYDGEIVVPDEAGIPDFGALQQAFDTQRTNDVVLYLFDVPYVAGHDLRSAPLQARRLVLKGLLAASNSDQIRFSEAFDAAPQSVLASACKLGLEGVIAKRRSSTYRSSRSADWVKLKCSQRQEFVIGGYTAPQGARTGFGALLLGVNDAQGALLYAGDVGTGFSEKVLKDLKKALDARAQSTSPFAVGSKIDGRPQWVTPTLVAEVSFGEWTRAGHIRHAVFRGLRTDKDASTIVREKALRMPSAKASNAVPSLRAHALSDRIHVTNPQRVIDTRTGTTKLELVRYYALVGDLMMKHLKGRPVSLVRAPDGVDGQLFFQKHAETEKLPGIRQLDPGLDLDHPPMIEVASKRGLLSAAQWNVVEFHTLNTGTVSFEHPDRMVFDLDPGEGVAWSQVQEAAQLMHSFLAQLGLPSFLKTSGGKGLHVVVPVKRLHDWGTVKGFSQAVVAHMAKTIPQRFVARSGPKNRVGRIFIDYLRNGLGATTVCAWSARARPGLGISVPVAWGELPSLRGGDHWSVKTVHERLDIGNEPWIGYARAARGLASAMSALGYAPPVA
ncbi:DNA ligase D [Aromatoleum diolicum]|uniref:DNA ligase (ATP) n=1 Tax=Aromatoleum diolicum TaxID=75796 RepID=A0ABX1QCX0_9RHOO|nr:DNA ligase D [Aromatoleum diolicum]NMG76249.1 DNA ligase D [Aromatoleum diolicum]